MFNLIEFIILKNQLFWFFLNSNRVFKRKFFIKELFYKEVRVNKIIHNSEKIMQQNPKTKTNRNDNNESNRKRFEQEGKNTYQVGRVLRNVQVDSDTSDSEQSSSTQCLYSLQISWIGQNQHGRFLVIVLWSEAERAADQLQSHLSATTTHALDLTLLAQAQFGRLLEQLVSECHVDAGHYETVIGHVALLFQLVLRNANIQFFFPTISNSIS